MKKLRSLLALGLTAALCLTPATAGSLQEDAAEAGLDWIIGQWGDKATNGLAVRLSYEWRLDGHLVGVKLTAPDRTAEGMIARNKTTGQIGYVSADSQGGGAVGTVAPESGNVVIKVAFNDGNSTEGKMAITHEQRSAETMKLTVSELSDTGEVLGTRMELELVRLKPAPPAPAETPAPAAVTPEPTKAPEAK